eukprot:TRINITY_DN4109_c0_g1_i12.p1 TRINITY_DN4109_c0_g1~~TRINITY_DN4109_c0_g1_i12.p1  ORF type:complete len:635 (-),score=32.59 TRINITY_DN4109_c0_g1_i12:2398-4101(-)
MSIVYGILIAIQLKKTLIIPRLPVDESFLLSGANWIDGYLPFSKIYDLDLLNTFLRQRNVEVWEVDEILKVDFYQPQCQNQDFQTCQNQVYKNTGNTNAPIDFGCTFPSKLFTKSFLFENEYLIKQILENLTPADQFDQLVKKIVTNIKQQSSYAEYNVLHLRTEKDFIAKCKDKKNIGNGEIRDNCIQNQESIGFHLGMKNFQLSTPIYIVSGTPIPESKFYNAVIQDLQLYGFSSTFDFFQLETLNATQFPPQIRSLVDYFVAIEAEKFVGNSQSFFSELLILERQLFGKWSSYYNSGNIPSSKIIPLFKMPLIIYSRCQNLDYFKSSPLIALRSAVYFGNVETYLYCFTSIDQTVENLLKSLDVTIIQKKEVEQFVKMFDQLEDIKTVSVISMLPYFDQYNHVLFVGPKTIIRKPVDLDEFNVPFPNELSTFFFEDQSFSGVMIANTFFIRKGISASGVKFMDILLSEKIGRQRNNKMLQQIENLNLKVDPGIIVYNQLLISDLEVFLVSGFCSSKIYLDCGRIIRNGCQCIIEYLLLSMDPQLYPHTLTYCNRHLQKSGEQML